MACLVKRSDNTLAYISKSNSVHLITHEHTPRPKPETKLSVADIQEKYDKLTELQKQYLRRKIEKLKK